MAASRRPSVFSRALTAVVVGGIVGLASSAASAAPAGDPAVVAKVTNLNKKALEAYSQQDYDGARDALKQALELCDSAGLDQHPITARTHIHFGAVAIVGYKQRELGIKHFRKALEIEPGIKLTKSIASPELQDAFEEAQAGGDSGKRGGGDNANAGGDDNGGGNANAADNGGGSDDNAKASGDDDGDDDHPRPRPRPRPKKKSSDDDSDDDKGSDNSGAGQTGTIFLGLTLGSSAGIASGSGHMNPLHKLSGPGFAIGQLGQIEPQVGFFVSPTMMLSAVLRLQYVSGLNGENLCGSNGTTFCNPLTVVGAFLARATWLLTDGPLRVTFGAQVGGGYVAHAVVFSTDNKCGSSQSTAGNTQCVDALLGGPFLFGPTVGLMYELGDSFNLIAALDTEIGAPKFTFNFDIDLGIGLRF